VNLVQKRVVKTTVKITVNFGFVLFLSVFQIHGGFHSAFPKANFSVSTTEFTVQIVKFTGRGRQVGRAGSAPAGDGAAADGARARRGPSGRVARLR
jgi:hypothetical protein